MFGIGDRNATGRLLMSSRSREKREESESETSGDERLPNEKPPVTTCRNRAETRGIVLDSLEF